MVAEILAGISLCNSAYKTIKESIANCKEVGQLAGSIDQLIEGKQQLDNAVKPTNRVTRKIKIINIFFLINSAIV